ncbi:MAG TPA: uroporphyrinogen-III synthase [Propionibacteriaceae bacterium]
MTFTSAPAAAATLEAADALGKRRQFVQALSDYVTTAAVGPVTAEPLRDAGIDPAVPDRYRLGALVRLVSDVLTQRHIQRFRCDGVIIELRGQLVWVGERRISLGPNSLAYSSRWHRATRFSPARNLPATCRTILMNMHCTWRSVGCAAHSTYPD